MLKTPTRKINGLEEFFLWSKENIQFAVNVSKPDMVPTVIQNIKNYNLGLHLKIDGLNFIWHDDPIHIYNLPSNIDNPREACDFINTIKFDFRDTFSVIAANDKTVAVTVSHMVCDGGFFKDIYSKLLDTKPYQLIPHVPIVGADCFKTELNNVTRKDIEKYHQGLHQLTSYKWSKNHEQLNTKANQILPCKYHVDESPVEEFQFFKSKVNLTDLYNFSFAMSIMSLNGQLQSNFGINTCVDLRQFIPQNKRTPYNTQNTSIVSVLADVHPKMTVREVLKLLHQDLQKKLHDSSPYTTYKCLITSDFPSLEKNTSGPELSNISRFFVSEEYSRKITDLWVQQSATSEVSEGGCFLLSFSRMKNGKNTLVTRFQQPRSVMNDKDGNLMIKSIIHLMKNVPLDVSVQEAYDELKAFQKGI